MSDLSPQEPPDGLPRPVPLKNLTEVDGSNDRYKILAYTGTGEPGQDFYIVVQDGGGGTAGLREYINSAAMSLRSRPAPEIDNPAEADIFHAVASIVEQATRDEAVGPLGDLGELLKDDPDRSAASLLDEVGVDRTPVLYKALGEAYAWARESRLRDFVLLEPLVQHLCTTRGLFRTAGVAGPRRSNNRPVPDHPETDDQKRPERRVRVDFIWRIEDRDAVAAQAKVWHIDAFVDPNIGSGTFDEYRANAWVKAPYVRLTSGVGTRIARWTNGPDGATDVYPGPTPEVGPGADACSAVQIWGAVEAPATHASYEGLFGWEQIVDDGTIIVAL